MSEGQEYEIEATMSGMTQNATYFLRVGFSKEGETKYFGSTWTESGWYDGTPSPIDYTKFYRVSTDETRSWLGKVKTTLSLPDGYESGSYVLKVSKYTEVGSGPTWSNEVPVTLTKKLVEEEETPSDTPSEESQEESSSCPEGMKVWIEPSFSTYEPEEEQWIKVCWSGLKNETVYFLKAAFYHDGTHTYKGQTKNEEGKWRVQKDSYNTQRKIVTDQNGKWEGDIFVKILKTEAIDLQGGGVSVKVGRYTEAGSGPTWSDPVPVEVASVSLVTDGDVGTSYPSGDNESVALESGKETTKEDEEENEEQNIDASHAVVLAEATISSDVAPLRIKDEKKRTVSPLAFMAGGLLLAASIFFVVSRRKQP